MRFVCTGTPSFVAANAAMSAGAELVGLKMRAGTHVSLTVALFVALLSIWQRLGFSCEDAPSPEERYPSLELASSTRYNHAIRQLT